MAQNKQSSLFDRLKAKFYEDKEGAFSVFAGIQFS